MRGVRNASGLYPGDIPHPPRSVGIIALAKNSRKIFEFKELIGKIFRTKELAAHFAPLTNFGGQDELAPGASSSLSAHN